MSNLWFVGHVYWYRNGAPRARLRATLIAIKCLLYFNEFILRGPACVCCAFGSRGRTWRFLRGEIGTTFAA